MDITTVFKDGKSRDDRASESTMAICADALPSACATRRRAEIGAGQPRGLRATLQVRHQ